MDNKISSGTTDSNLILSDIVTFYENAAFPECIAVRVHKINVGRLRRRSDVWRLEALDVIHCFWNGGVIEEYHSLTEAKKGAVNYYEKFILKYK